MARDEQALKLANTDAIWASNSANRADADLSALANPLTRTDGWTSEYSVDGGDDLQRLVWNRLFYELTSFCEDVNRTGVLEYDASVDYQADAVVNHAGALYRALVASGPASSNATTPGTDASVWIGLFAV